MRRELTALIECIGLACCILDGKREPVIGLRDLKKPRCNGRFDRSSTLAHLLGPRAVVVSVGLGFTEQRKECVVHGDNADAQAMLGALSGSRRGNQSVGLFDASGSPDASFSHKIVHLGRQLSKSC